MSLILDPRKVQKDLAIPKGATFYSYEDDFNKINLLDSGNIQFFIQLDNPKIERSILTIQNKRIILPYLLLLDNKIPIKLLTLNDSVIHSYPFMQNPLSFFTQNIPTAKSIMISILTDFNEILNQYKSFFSFYSEVNKFFDNLILFLTLSKLDTNLVIYSDDSFNLFKISKEYETLFKNYDGFFPGLDNFTFFETDNSRFINKNYQFHIDKEIVDQDQVNLAFSFKKISSEIQDNLFNKNTDFVYLIAKSISKQLNNLILLFKNKIIEIDNKLDRIFSNSNNLVYITLKSINDKYGKEKTSVYYNYFYKYFESFSDRYKSIFQLISLPFNLNIKNDLLFLTEKKVKQPEITKNLENTGSVDSIISDLINDSSSESFSLDSIIIKDQKTSVPSYQSKIFNELCSFGKISSDDSTLLSKALDAFLKLTDKTADNNNVRKIHKAIRTVYFKFYTQIFLQYLESKNLPKVVEKFLKFGVIDERLITPNDMNFIMEFKDQSKVNYEIYNPIDWFTTIYDEKIEPSIDELGQSFTDMLREEEKRYKKSEESDLPINLRKLKFEIESFYQIAYRILTSSPLTALPIFFSENIRGNINEMILTKEKIANEFDWIKDIDYSLFFREAIYRQEEIYDIYKKEILPYIIILPGIGDRVIMWQDCGTNKYMPARFVFPSVFTGSDLRKSIAQACATFRWESNKTMKGPGWADATSGGLTGLYLDYLQFYQKSNDLSIEAKQQLKESLSKYRTDREKFANDYIQWIFFESQGILKLNVLLRRIFIFEIPFKKDILLKLQRLPAYEKLVTTFINKRKIELRSNISRYKKFEDDESNLPDEIQEYMNMLKT